LSAQFSCYLPVDLCQQKPTIKNTYTLFFAFNFVFFSARLSSGATDSCIKKLPKKIVCIAIFASFYFPTLFLAGSLFSFYFFLLCFVINAGQSKNIKTK